MSSDSLYCPECCKCVDLEEEHDWCTFCWEPVCLSPICREEHTCRAGRISFTCVDCETCYWNDRWKGDWCAKCTAYVCKADCSLAGDHSSRCSGVPPAPDTTMPPNNTKVRSDGS